MARVTFYYDFSCPYAYLASTRIDELARRAGAEVEYCPFLLGGVFRELGVPDMAGMAPARARLNALDMQRWATHWDVPLNMPPSHPNRTVTALRAALAAPDLPRASHALFIAYWQDGSDLSDPSVISAALDAAGLDGAALVRAAQQPEMKEELHARTRQALNAGVFGAPAFVVDRELYWGQDRLHQVARALGAGPSAVPDPPLPAARAGGRLEFWYDFSSPFAYLASTQVEALAQESGAELSYRPFLLGGLFKQIGTADVPLHSFSEPKQRFMRRDMQRFAEQYGVGFRLPSRFPLRTVLALRVAQLSGSVPLVHALFSAAWVKDRDIADPDVVRAICSETGGDPGWVDGADAAEAKAALRAATEQAEVRGLCGAPSFIANGELFWGQDRMDFVRRALRRGTNAPADAP